MKKRMWFIGALVCALVLGTATSPVFAGEVKNREENQQDRIAQGIKSGQLTPTEAARLEHMEHKTEANRKKALSDGKMTPKEYKKLNHEENKTSKKIYQAKHNKKNR